VLGRHRKALATLGRLFKTGAIGKCYWAVVEGGPDEDEGTIDLSLGRRDESRGWWMKPDPDGQPAVTKWKVLGRTAPTGEPFGDARAASASPPPVSAASGGEGARPSRGTEIDSMQLTWLALEPVTGRTHQLRVHCAEQGWPIVGDSIYGTQASLRSLRKEGAPRTRGPALHLHSREIIVPLYKNRDPIKVMAPVPITMQQRLYACGWQGEVFHLVD
jgi:tRNA pseudouridine32 synthase/23S rRNA pseudouridine746 synthase